ncbi:MAG TPA: hypothetical protein VFW90_01820 [Candidatus Saccharimonadales bacterium]|nr:hypothetical protein [Candidatus Saccharimonadales bacterium]
MSELLARTQFFPGREPITTHDYEPSDADRENMYEAIEQARRALAAGDNPIGAVLWEPSSGMKWKGQTEEIRRGDAEAHAEKLVYRDLIAERPEYGHDLSTFCMYSPAEPCVGCSHLVDQVNLGILFIAATRDDASGFFRKKKIRMENILAGSERSFTVISGLLAVEALELLTATNRIHR